jgi:redox-sensitive bicupin YhaK (pirin superfamily)
MNRATLRLLRRSVKLAVKHHRRAAHFQDFSSMPFSYAQQRNTVFPQIDGRRHSLATMIIRKANERGHGKHGWLDSYHTFSFANYYDPKWIHFRKLRVINDDLVMPGMGFGTHPHRDMEIISFVLSGALQHRDSMGNGRIIRTGDFQYMAAGTGVEHSEFNPSDTEATRFLQIWIMPDTKDVKPRYAEKAMAKAETGKWHLITSKTGRDGSMAIHQDADLLLAKLDAGQSVNHVLSSKRHAWVHVAEGEVKINGKNFSGGDAIGASKEEALEISAAKPSQVLLFDLN